MFENSKNELKDWLVEQSKKDSSYLKTIEAFNIAEKYHTGYRKDGIVEEFQHQINIANTIRPFVNDLKYPSETFIIVLLHDLIEDYGINDSIWDMGLDRLSHLSPVPFSYIQDNYSGLVIDSLDAISKKVDDKKKKSSNYFKGIEKLPIAGVVKLADRIDNLNSMLFVFTVEKQIKYANEAEKHFLKIAEVGKELFPEQKNIYINFEKKIKNLINKVKETEEFYNKHNLNKSLVPLKPTLRKNRVSLVR